MGRFVGFCFVESLLTGKHEIRKDMKETKGSFPIS
jgi:hypothetical protein